MPNEWTPDNPLRLTDADDLDCVASGAGWWWSLASGEADYVDAPNIASGQLAALRTVRSIFQRRRQDAECALAEIERELRSRGRRLTWKRNDKHGSKEAYFGGAPAFCFVCGPQYGHLAASVSWKDETEDLGGLAGFATMAAAQDACEAWLADWLDRSGVGR